MITSNQENNCSNAQQLKNCLNLMGRLNIDDSDGDAIADDGLQNGAQVFGLVVECYRIDGIIQKMKDCVLDYDLYQLYKNQQHSITITITAITAITAIVQEQPINYYNTIYYSLNQSGVRVPDQ